MNRFPSWAVAAAGLAAAAPAHRARAQRPEAVRKAVSSLEFRAIGPAVMGGRIADLAVVESHPQTFYVGTATGGVWKTENDGTSWTPVFDDQPASSIGDVTVAPSNPNVVWVGTGEPQNRQSSPWGNGAYKSTDAGRTWRHTGLEATHHIARIVIHPRDPDVVYVAAVGHLWGPNPERGVYRTTDGGDTWEKVLYVDDNTGAIDLVMDPGDPNTLFAAMYQRRRTGWGFNGGGPGSGIYRTLDGGDTWTELTHGLPDGDKGRIGLDVYRRDGNVVYALVEADKRDPTQQGFGGGGQQRRGESKSGLYRSTDRGETWERVSGTNPRPMYFSQVRIDPSDRQRLYVLGTQFYISDDGGKTFRTDLATEIHVDFHAMWVDPHDPDHLIVGEDGGVATSLDRGVHWRMYDNLPIGQFYQITVDMRDPYYVCGGLQDNDSWCGPSRTLTTHGVRNSDWYEVWGGDGFFNVADPSDYRVLFTESQNGFMGRYDVPTGETTSLRPIPGPRSGGDEERAYRFNWDTPIEMSPTDPQTIYLGAQVLLRSRDRGMTWEEASPDLTKAIDRKTLSIMGVRGDQPMIAPNDGISNYGDITTISESPRDANVIYVGTDDGNVQLTRDAGQTWTDLTTNVKGVPARTYVSRVVASQHEAGRVYATFDGHRNDDYTPYAFVSDDYGAHWRAITDGLPDGWSVNVLVEHPTTADLLFLGNEIGVYVSPDRGAHWTRLQGANFPTVPVDDIAIHPRDNDLVVGTHGRSIWILHDLGPLEQLTPAVLAEAAHVFPVPPVTMWSLAGNWEFPGAIYEAKNPPVAARIRYYLRDALAAATPMADADGSTGGPSVSRRRPPDTAAATKATITVLDPQGTVVRTLEGPGDAGIQEVLWDLRYDAPYETEGEGGGGFFGAPRGPRVLPGSYTVRLEAAGATQTTAVQVRPEPRRTISDADRATRQDVLMRAYHLARPLHDAGEAVRQLTQRVSDVKKLLGDHADAPAALKAAADSLSTDLSDVSDKLRDANRDLRFLNAVEGSTTPPTADQAWQLTRLEERTPELIHRVNAMIVTRLPDLYKALGAQGIHPGPTTPIAIPKM